MPSDAHFERLAPELLLPILSQLPDLDALDCLLRASPATYHLFEVYGADIFEAVLSNSSRVASDQTCSIQEYTCALIRIVALIRSSALPRQAFYLERFQDLIRHESTFHRYCPPRWTLPPSKISSEIPVTVLWGLLASHRKISVLTISCLEFYLERFRALKPRHLADKNFEFKNMYEGPDKPFLWAWQQKPDTVLFLVQDIGDPTWVEEQRVLRAFWRWQLFQDLKLDANGPRSPWTGSDITTLNYMDSGDLYDVPIFALWLRPDGTEISTHGGQLGMSEGPCQCIRSTLFEQELVRSVDDYMKENSNTIQTQNFLHPSRRRPRLTLNGPQELATIVECTPQISEFFCKLDEDYYGAYNDSWDLVDLNGPCSPLMHVTFEPFRPLGLAIWDTKRIDRYGLTCSNVHTKSINNAYVAWKSILGKDDLEKYEQKSSARWARKLRREARRVLRRQTSDGDDSDSSELTSLTIG